MGNVDPILMGELKELLRSCLKLGAGFEIADDMLLVGGPVDIDSIDILLIVSQVEKKFSMKIPNEAVGRTAFASVQSLAEFIQANRETLALSAAGVAGGTAAGVGADGNVDWLSRLPHGPEFRFISEVREVDPGRAAFGIWQVRGDEGFFAGHFPGRPVVPGVLITEALAQMAGIAAASGEADAASKAGVIAHFEMQFVKRIVPPAAIELRAQVVDTAGALRTCEVIASVSGMAAAKGKVSIQFGLGA